MASIYQRSESWYVKYTDASGQRIRVSVPARTKTEARQIANELQRTVDRQRAGLEVLPSESSMTFGALIEWWLKNRCPEHSVYRERMRFETHIIEQPIGRLPLRIVTTDRIEEVFIKLEKSGAAPASVNKLRSILHTIFVRARKAKVWLGVNPITDTEIRRVIKRTYQTLRVHEVPLVLAEVPDEWRDFFAAALWTGMRKGELCGLLKSDVDLELGRMTCIGDGVAQ